MNTTTMSPRLQSNILYGIFAVAISAIIVFAVYPLFVTTHVEKDATNVPVHFAVADSGGGDGGGDGGGGDGGGAGDGGGDGGSASGDGGTGDGGGDGSGAGTGDSGAADGGGDAGAADAGAGDGGGEAGEGCCGGADSGAGDGGGEAGDGCCGDAGGGDAADTGVPDGGGASDPTPQCTLVANPSTIYRGESSYVSWGSSGGNSVSIVGGVDTNNAPSGFTLVSPSATQVYQLVVSNGTGSVSCFATVTVLDVPIPQLPNCVFTAGPSPVNVGDLSTLTWTTSNADTVSIDNGVGTVDANGTRDVNVVADTTYTLTASNSVGFVTCFGVITTVPVVPDAPTCDAFTASPAALTAPGVSTLTWGTTNADTVSINNGVGAVAVDGSQSVNVAADTTYTLTATNAQGTVTCQTAVDITTMPPAGPTCDAFTATPSARSGAGAVTLAWDTTGATAVSINQGVGSVAVDGSQSVNVAADTTYTLTATDGTDSVTCQTSVDITGGGGGGGGGSSGPRCEFTASDTDINFGERVTLTWKNARTNDMTLVDSFGTTLIDTEASTTVDEDAGSITVSPSRTTTYTLTAIRGSRDRECRVIVNVGGVSLTSNRIQGGISLAQVPYTGFEAGPVLTTIFYVGVIIWGLIIAYLLVMRKRAGHTFTKAESFVASVAPQMTRAEPVAVGTVPENLPVEPEVTVTAVDESLRVLEAHAHAQWALVSSDALRFIVGQGGNPAEHFATLDRVITLAKNRYPKENGWMVINKEKLITLLA